MPDKIIFSKSECRRQVAAYKNNSPSLTRVCGHKANKSEESDYCKAQGINMKPMVAKGKGRLATPPPRSKSPKSFTARFPTPPGKSKGANLGAEMVKTAQSGLKPAPTGQGKTKKSVDVKPDPMVMAIQQLTAAFGSLDQQFKGMNHSLQELQVRADDREAKVENQLCIVKKRPNTPQTR
jgi:hypothetical protein